MTFFNKLQKVLDSVSCSGLLRTSLCQFFFSLYALMIAHVDNVSKHHLKPFGL
ncbi:hypothetical protein [Sphingorhabdus sp.]|uniref:hypothetical protein n=1 Tax=Sphingorhabdus sp. TaxID=1902408 RepID=UPI0037CCC0AC